MLRSIAAKQNHHAGQSIISLSERVVLTAKGRVCTKPWGREVNKGAHPRLGAAAMAVDQLRWQSVAGKALQNRFKQAAAQLRMGGNEGGNEGDTRGLHRPCWDCGQRTGSFCDGVGGPCLARSTCPAEEWGQRQRTPLCIGDFPAREHPL
mgnify:CR=1 FL=1